jgi:predicted Zn-dependent protease
LIRFRSMDGYERKLLVAVTATLFSCCLTCNLQTPQQGRRPENAGAGAAAAQELPRSDKFNLQEDEFVCKQALAAWRLARAHDERGVLTEAAWNQLRRDDEVKSMEMLATLSRQFPEASYVKTMMGQVMQHFGRNSEAAAYYEEATLLSRHDPALYFKAGEMKRKGSHFERAMTYYKKAFEMKPDYTAARVGYARCLLAGDKTAESGRKMLEAVLAKNPDDQDALKALSESKGK